MSTKSTLFSTNCCHIYKDYLYDVDGYYDSEKYVLCIVVSYGEVDDKSDYIEVEWDSDFAFLIRTMLDYMDLGALDKLCRDYHRKMMDKKTKGRSEEISEFITANMQDVNVISNASKRFDMSDKEIESMKIIKASLAPIDAMMNIFNVYGDVAKEGLQMIEEVKLKHGLND